MEPLEIPMGPKKSRKSLKVPPKGAFLPLAKKVSHFVDFETLQNLQNRAPVYIKHRFSPFGPTLKMSPK